MQDADVAACLPRPSAESDKYRRGVLGIVAGSNRFTGAATLAIGGALRGGAGMVRLVTAEAAAAVARQHWPEALITIADTADPPIRPRRSRRPAASRPGSPGRAWEPTTTRPACSRPCSPATCPCSWTPMA